MRIAQLCVYLIKSCRGTELAAADLDPRGFRGDRRLMVVDREGRFLTQREHPELARVVPRLEPKGLAIEVEGDEGMRLFLPDWLRTYGPRVPVSVWKHRGPAIVQGNEACDFFSTFLHRHALLVCMPDDDERVPNRLPAGVAAGLGFADGYPLLLASDASLAELNRELPDDELPVPMDRFRPNIVVTGCDEPWKEERWNRFEIRGIPFYGVKPCERCPITQTDQRRGERTGKEPLRTLARIHRDGHAALFGANLIHAGLGTLRVGDPIERIVYGERPQL